MAFVEIFRGSETEVAKLVKEKGAIARGSSQTGTRYYRCHHYRTFRSCPLKLKSVYEEESYVLYQKGEHEHEGPSPPRIGIDCSELREKVKLYATSGCNLTQIRRIVDKEGFEVPDDSQLKNAVAYDRRTSSDLPPNINSEDVHLWCQNHQQIPADPHKMFVLPGFHVTSPNDCFIFMTTKHLLGQTANRPFIQVDCTYKLLLNNCPIMIAGTSDLKRHFHPFGIAIVDSDEKTTTYNEFFTSIVSGSESLMPGFKFSPEFVMGDGCPGISAAVREVFPDARRLMCFSHVMSNVRKNRGSGLLSEKLSALENDISALQLCQFDDQFKLGSSLFRAKWGYTDDETVTKFFKYFNNQYLSQLPFWYEGGCRSFPLYQ